MRTFFLMVLANDLEPDRVSRAFEMQPYQCWRKGERLSFVMKNGKTRRLASKQKWGGWKIFFKSPKTDQSLVREIIKVVMKLNKRKTQVRALVRSGHMISLVSLVQGTSRIMIPPELHMLLAGLGIHLILDFWPHPDRD